MKWLLILLLFLVFSAGQKVQAQDQEIEQLALDVEKLSQFKQILSDMKTGYDVVMKGYMTVRNISEGNFNLHKAFLDGLLAVSPAVRKYKKVADISEMQLQIVQEYKTAYRQLRASGHMNPDELLYIGKVYDNLLDQSLKNLSDLATVVTAGELRMSDAERLAAIDHIYSDTLDKLLFLRSFNNQAAQLVLERKKESKEIQDMQAVFGNSTP